MLSCWRVSPESRPLFDSLEKSIAKLLERDVAKHYTDLNDPYEKENITYFNSDRIDYLALMGSPEGHAPRAPNVLNSVDSDSNAIQQSTSNSHPNHHNTSNINTDSHNYILIVNPLETQANPKAEEIELQNCSS